MRANEISDCFGTESVARSKYAILKLLSANEKRVLAGLHLWDSHPPASNLTQAALQKPQLTRLITHDRRNYPAPKQGDVRRIITGANDVLKSSSSPSLNNINLKIMQNCMLVWHRRYSGSNLFHRPFWPFFLNVHSVWSAQNWHQLTRSLAWNLEGELMAEKKRKKNSSHNGRLQIEPIKAHSSVSF